MSRVLAFDVGKSGCRAVLFDDGSRVGMAEQAGARGLADPTGAEAAATAMAAVARQLGHDEAEPLRLDAVAAGLAGLAHAPTAAQELARRLAQAHRVRTVVLASDMTTSHLGALRGEPGVVVAAGTGAVALGVSPSGEFARVDGWGYLLGDAGSGYAIARRGLEAALRAHDGRQGSPALRELAAQRFGDLDELPQTLHGHVNPARLVAGFSREVLRAAEQGDACSQALWRDAGVELARSAAAAAGRLSMDEVVVSTTGGLFDAGSWLNEPFADELARRLPQARRQPAQGDALDGAFVMATQPDVPHQTLLVRPRADPSEPDRLSGGWR